jgi:IS1 family transposase
MLRPWFRLGGIEVNNPAIEPNQFDALVDIAQKRVHLKAPLQFLDIACQYRASRLWWQQAWGSAHKAFSLRKIRFGSQVSLANQWMPVNSCDFRGSSSSISRHEMEFVDAFPLNLYYDPSSFRIYDSFGIQESSICRLFLMRQTVSHRLGSGSGLFSLFGHVPGRNSGNENQQYIGQVLGRCETLEVCFRVLFGAVGIISGIVVTYKNNRSGWMGRLLDGCGLVLICSGFGAFLLPVYYDCRYNDECRANPPSTHNRKIVPHKYLPSNSYWGTVIDMANILNTDKQIAVIGALAEGSSIRSIERITGVHRDTIMRLGVKVGQGCAAVMDSKMRNLPCHRLEMDEIWGFVGKKDRNVRIGDDTAVGSVWTFCAIDAETKLVPAFKVGDRSAATAKAFVQDVADRMAYRVQISTDGLNAYVAAMESAFGGNVDYAQIIKTYGREETTDNRRYSAPEFVSSEKIIHVGNPDVRLISTSYIERLNATTRLHMRRLTRLTLAFSKKRENFEAAVALHFAYYNFVKRHNTLRCTPAMAAGVANSFWSVGDLVEAAV